MLTGRRKTSAFQHPVELIDERREDLCGYRRHRRRHDPPSFDQLPCRLPRGIGGFTATECLDRTVTRQNVRPFLGHVHWSVVKNLVRRVSSWLGVRDCCEERLEEGAQKPRHPAQGEAEVVAGC